MTTIVTRGGKGSALSFSEADANLNNLNNDKIEADTIDTLTNKTIVVADNTVTTAASGNLVATELNAALAELDGQDTTVQGNLDTHIADTTTHGTTGDIVGTTDTQSVSNKTITASDITVGSGKTLDVSAGTLTLANDQISGDSIDGGTISNFTSTGIDDNATSTQQTITNTSTAFANRIDVDGGAIRFPSTQVPSAGANDFDDYAEGTWTPGVEDAASGGNAGTYTLIDAEYTKYGRVVTAQCHINDIDTTGMTAGNDVFITGLPFVSRSNTSHGALYVNNITFAGNLIARIPQSSAYFNLREVVSGVAADSVIVSELSSTVSDIEITITYFTD